MKLESFKQLLENLTESFIMSLKITSNFYKGFDPKKVRFVFILKHGDLQATSTNMSNSDAQQCLEIAINACKEVGVKSNNNNEESMH